jgi:hypothetical protein
MAGSRWPLQTRVGIVLPRPSGTYLRKLNFKLSRYHIFRWPDIQEFAIEHFMSRRAFLGFAAALGALASTTSFTLQAADAERVPIPPRDPRFSFYNSKEGLVEQFALGPTDSETQSRARQLLLKKYDQSGNGKLDADEETRLRQDFFVQRKRFIAKHDKNGDENVKGKEVEYFAYLMYLRRLKFMRGFDLDRDGRLNEEETAAMRAELSKRQDKFWRNFHK